MFRAGSRASSARFDAVSIPVYAIIATGTASAKLLHVGVVPQSTLSIRMLGLNTR